MTPTMMRFRTGAAAAAVGAARFFERRDAAEVEIPT